MAGDELSVRDTHARTARRFRLAARQSSCVGLVGLAALFGGGNAVALLATGSWALRPWMTVAAALVLAIGSLGAASNRTWGVLTLLVSATAFGGVWIAGIAPAVFLLVPALASVVLGTAATSLVQRYPREFWVATGLAVGGGGLAVVLAGPVLPWLLG